MLHLLKNPSYKRVKKSKMCTDKCIRANPNKQIKGVGASVRLEAEKSVFVVTFCQVRWGEWLEKNKPLFQGILRNSVDAY
jgi:hypothetical protein